MDFIKAIKMAYERDAVIKRESKDYCIYKNERTARLRKLSFSKIGKVIYEGYSLLSYIDTLSNDWAVTNEYNELRARDNLIHRKLSISKLPKKRFKEVKI